MRNLSRAERRGPSRQVQRDLKGIAKGMVARSSGSRRLPFNIPFTDKSDRERDLYAPVSPVDDRLFDRIPDSCTIHEVPVRLPWGQGLRLVDHADDPRTRAERIKLTWSLILLAVHPVSPFDKILCPVCVTNSRASCIDDDYYFYVLTIYPARNEGRSFETPNP